MSLYYKATRSSIASKDGVKKWFPAIVKSKHRVKTKTLANEIAYGTTLAPGDVHHVLRTLPQYMFPHLLNSKSVSLEGLGTFTIMIDASGSGVNTPEEVNPNQVKYLRVQFTPEYTMPMGVGKTRSQFASVEYERWGDVEKTTETPGENTGTGEGNGEGEGDWQDPTA